MSIVRRNGVADPTISSSERASVRMQARGIDLPAKPEYDIPYLPDDITALGDEALMELFVRFTNWAEHVAIRSAAAMVDEREAEQALEQAEAAALIKGWGGTSKDRVTVAKAERQADPEVVRLRDQQLERYAYRKMVEVLSNSTEAKCKLVSRELTRRTSNYDVTQRASRFTA